MTNRTPDNYYRHCIKCGNNIPKDTTTCAEAGFGEGCGNKIADPTPSTWREDFDEVSNTFYGAKRGQRIGACNFTESGVAESKERIKQWIADLLKKRDEELVKKVEGMRLDYIPKTAGNPYWGNGYNQALAHILIEISSDKK